MSTGSRIGPRDENVRLESGDTFSAKELVRIGRKIGSKWIDIEEADRNNYSIDDALDESSFIGDIDATRNLLEIELENRKPLPKYDGNIESILALYQARSRIDTLTHRIRNDNDAIKKRTVVRLIDAFINSNTWRYTNRQFIGPRLAAIQKEIDFIDRNPEIGEYALIGDIANPLIGRVINEYNGVTRITTRQGSNVSGDPFYKAQILATLVPFALVDEIPVERPIPVRVTTRPKPVNHNEERFDHLPGDTRQTIKELLVKTGRILTTDIDHIGRPEVPLYGFWDERTEKGITLFSDYHCTAPRVFIDTTDTDVVVERLTSIARRTAS